MHQVSLRDARTRNDRRWIEGVYRDYLTDLAPAATGIFPALGEIGHREPDQLLRWFDDRSAQVLTILYSLDPAGFAMVRRRPPPAGSPDAKAEFSMAPARNRGAGRAAVI
jgi:hypothetical protein